MAWAERRRFQYLSGVLGFILIILFIIFYPVIFKKPTCSDGKKNGTETGVDCGGSCSRMCKETVSEPLVHWSRAFLIGQNMYNFAAFVENQNRDGAIETINYEFRAYDSNNRLLGRRQGTTYIPPGKKFVVFEPRFDAGEFAIKNVTFEFIPPFDWVKKEPKLNTLDMTVDNITLGEDLKNPSLSARIKNDSIYDIPYFEIVAVLYDDQGNAINVSRTFRDGLNSNNTTSVFFTWPEMFRTIPVTNDIFIEINPFDFSI